MILGNSETLILCLSQTPFQILSRSFAKAWSDIALILEQYQK